MRYLITHKLWQGISLAILLFAPFSTIYADSALSVTPVYSELSIKKRASTITIYNESDHPVVLQTEVFAWDQDSTKDGNDILTPSRDVIVSPPIIRVAKRAKQTFRVGLRRAPARDKTLAYRVYFRQVSASPTVTAGVSMLMRLGVPVFIKPASPNVKRNIASYVKFEARKKFHEGVHGIVLSVDNGMDEVFWGGKYDLYQGSTLIADNLSLPRTLPHRKAARFGQPKSFPYRGAPLSLYMRYKGKKLGPYPVHYKR